MDHAMDRKLEELFVKHRTRSGLSTKEKTIRLYTSTTSKLLRTIGQEGWDKTGYAAAHAHEIEAYVNSFQNVATRRSVAQAVYQWLLAIGADPSIGASPDLIDHYGKMSHELGLELRTKAASQEASAAQIQNWVSWPDLKRVVRELGKQLEKEGVLRGSGDLPRQLRPLLLKYMVGCLYTMAPPRRLDYRTMEVVSRAEFDQLPPEKRMARNFLVRVTPKNKMNFVFGDYKTAGKYGEQTLPVPPPLAKVLRCWLGYNHVGPYLFGPLPLSAVQMTRLINDTFAATGKKVSANLLRHSYITHFHPPGDLADRQQDAAAMAHSLGMQACYAVKV